MLNDYIMLSFIIHPNNNKNQKYNIWINNSFNIIISRVLPIFYSEDNSGFLTFTDEHNILYPDLLREEDNPGI